MIIRPIKFKFKQKRTHRYLSSRNEFNQLKNWINHKQKILVLTGAGVSTDSGLPDYRGPRGAYTRGYTPITYMQFMGSVLSRKRYWARSMINWPFFSTRFPNHIHTSILHYQQLNHVKEIVTQNVDGLHHKAGSHNITELHGSLFHVKCTSCQSSLSRDEYQLELDMMNPTIKNITQKKVFNPDGDIDLDIDFSTVQVPHCKLCGGIVKPDIVFFGESVPKNIVDKVYKLVEETDGLLVIGTSLHVFSAFRIVKYANEKKSFYRDHK